MGVSYDDLSSDLQLDKDGFLHERYFADYVSKHSTHKTQRVNTVIVTYVVNGRNVEFFQNRNEAGDDHAWIPELATFIRYGNENLVVRRIRLINSSGLQFIEIHIERPF